VEADPLRSAAKRARPTARTGVGVLFRQLQHEAALARQTGEPVGEVHERLGELLRRRFLGGSIGLGALLALPSLACSSSGDATPISTSTPGADGGAGPGRVTVVGAGLAGLTAAYRLTLAGADVTVHEAADRLGGRTRTVRDFFGDGRNAEAGGEFVDSGHRAMRALIRELGLDQDDLWEGYPDGSRSVDVYDGEVYRRADLVEDWSIVAPAVDRDLAAAGSEVLWNSHTEAAVEIDRTSLAEWIELNVPGGRRSRLGRLIEVNFLSEWAGPIEEQSSLNFLTTVGSGTGGGTDLLGGQDFRWHVAGGNDRVAGRLGERLGEERLRYGSRLVAIRSSADVVTCSFDEAGTVTDVAADRLVLALPFSTLRTVDLDGAELSDLKRRVISDQPIGTNSKLHLEFERRAWQDDGLNGDTTSDTGLMVTWDGIISEPGATGVLVSFSGGGAGAGHAFPEAHGPAPPVTVAARDSDLVTVFGQSTLDAATGRGWLDSWADDQYALGSYAYWAVGQYTGLRGAGGTPEGPIHFCGEHTSLEYAGFMNGAVESGERAAAEILGG